ncbi:MAG: FAD-dependent monooxygenase [Gammaproteobacteria bacterium]|nr:FAD-dependent monooxygenase [Gammaproteobacteria bacterium]
MYYDLIIVGGGLVGAGLAAALRSSGLQIALIDARLPSNDDPRLFALSDSSCQFLKNLGLWPSLSAYAAPIRTVHVSYQGHFGAVRLRSEEVQLQALGHVIPARYIEAALHASLNSLADFTLYQPATLKSLQQLENEVHLTVMTQEGEKQLTAPLLIAADGADSTVRKELNMAANVFDYEQSAIVTKTLLKRPHQGIAYERFNANGAIAMLPLVDDECATIWTVDNEIATTLMQLSDEAFLQHLQRTFGYRLGRLQRVSQRHLFPLKKISVEKNVEKNIFLLGNAAHTLHPIAAQGFNLAIYEVALLVEGLKEKILSQQAFTARDLQQISERAQKQQAISMGLSHRLSRAFTSHSVFFSMALQMGMIGLDILTPVKKLFIKKIMGKIGNVPHLLLDASNYEETLSA